MPRRQRHRSRLFDRVDAFNAMRNNRGTMVIDNDAETLTNIAVPLGTLDKLQAQSQEQMASVAQTPLVKLLGITPSGLNASSDGEIRVFYDSIHAIQEHLFGVPMMTVIKLAQLDLGYDIDPDIGYKFLPLWELDEAAKAAVRKTNADSDGVLVEAGILHPEESRQRLASDPESPYSDLDVEDVPEPEDLGEADVSAASNPAKSAEPRAEERSGV